MNEHLSAIVAGTPAERTRGLAVEETPDAIVIVGAGYRLDVSRHQATAELELNGRRIATLLMGSGLDTLEAADEDTTLSTPELDREGEEVTFTWRGQSAPWPAHTEPLTAWAQGFSYGYAVEGQGAIDRAYLLRTRAKAAAAHSVRMFNPEPNSGCVHYTGERCAPDKSCVLCYPEKFADANLYNWLPDFSLIGVEAEPSRFELMQMVLRDNYIDPDDHDLLRAAVAARDGEVLLVGIEDRRDIYSHQVICRTR